MQEARDLWKINKKTDKYDGEETAQTLKELLDDLENQKLITPEERTTIEKTEKVKIGSRTIDFSERKEIKIGDYVAYPVDLRLEDDYLTDWRIFYKNDEYVFIIAAAPIPGDLQPQNEWPTTISTKSGMPDVKEEVATKFQLSWRIGRENETGYGAPWVAALMDTEIYSSFTAGLEGVEAIGAPTIEMFVKSWNEHGFTPLYLSMKDMGYKIGVSPDVFDDYCYFPEQEGSDVSLYRSGNYWLAAPSGVDTSGTFGRGVCIVQPDKFGFISGMIPEWSNKEPSYSEYCTRPLVAVPIDMFKGQDSQGIWLIESK